MSHLEPDASSHPLRYAYVGAQMNWPAHLFEAAHKRRGDDVRWYRSPSDLPRRPAPDVVVHGLFEHESNGPLGACDLAALLPPTTLLVTIWSQGQESEIMTANHILKGHCHPRSMLYVPGSAHGTPDAVLPLYEQALTDAEGVSIEGEVDRLAELTSDIEDLIDLGEIMAESEPIARLLVAATTPWSTWQNLADRLHYAHGSVRNIQLKLGDQLRASGLLEPDEALTAPRFATFATAHRLFIASFANGHLGGFDDI